MTRKSKWRYFRFLDPGVGRILRTSRDLKSAGAGIISSVREAATHSNADDTREWRLPANHEAVLHRSIGQSRLSYVIAIIALLGASVAAIADLSWLLIYNLLMTFLFFTFLGIRRAAVACQIRNGGPHNCPLRRITDWWWPEKE